MACAQTATSTSSGTAAEWQRDSTTAHASSSNSRSRFSAAGVTGVRPAQTLDLQFLVNGIEAAQRANHAHMVPFTVAREYQLFSGDDPQSKGTVLVAVHFQPPGSKTWEIKKATGSGRAEKVVKEILQREVQYAKDDKIAISWQDYDFRYAGSGESDRRPCHILQIIPKREDGKLLRGRIWIDRDTYLIHRFEGEPAKNPSWWIKDLKLSTTYSDMGGMWLQNTSEGKADVRLLGPHSMTQRTLSYTAARPVMEGPAAELARITRPQHPYRPSPTAAVGAGIISVR